MARPALAALAEQQAVIQRQAELIQRQSATINAQGQRLAAHEQVFSAQREQLIALGRGLQALAAHAGVEPQIRTAMLKRADEQNPAQPIPEPPAQPPVQTTEDAKTPEAMADVTAPGLVPGSTNDVAADAASTVYTPGDDIPGPPLKNLVDVTAPVDGTQGPRPLNEVRTLTDVRVGDPMNPQTAFPPRGDFAQVPRLGAKEAASNRTMAALHLARLRLTAGTATADSDFAEATAIEKDAAMTTERIQAEIDTLGKVATAAAKKERPAGLVPKAAAAQRTVPSLSSTAGSGGTATASSDVEDSDLFLD